VAFIDADERNKIPNNKEIKANFFMCTAIFRLFILNFNYSKSNNDYVYPY
jgi:hypothetical protein